MSYTINLTNGNKLADITDGSINQTATNLTLVGKNISNYGTFVNDNFVWLLENFANNTAPTYPLVGQLWYDTSENLLKVYTGAGFAPTGNTLVSSTQPTSLNAGGLWINSLTEQLFFNDGTNTVLAGPIYTAAQGQSGFIVEDILDVNSINHTIVKLLVGGELIGIYSKDNTFTPANAIAGFTGNILAGFNTGSEGNLAYDLQAASALALVDANGVLHSTASFMSSIDDTFANGVVSFRNNVTKFGPGEELQIAIGGLVAQIQSNSINQDLQLTARRTGTSVYDPAVYISAANQAVGIYTSSPGATLDVNGNTIIRGNLTVQGATTTINSSTLTVDDILIELGSVITPTNTTANGGGIKLYGATNKTFLWSNSYSAWVSSENINLSGTNAYMIAGDTVLSHGSLGATVATSSLTSVGHLTTLNAAWIGIANSTISYVNSANSNGNIYLAPKGTGTVDVSSAKITNVATPGAGTDAANKSYVDNSVQGAAVAIGLNVGSLSNDAIASTFLNVMFPVAEHIDGTVCRAACTNTGGTTAIKKYTLSVGTSTWVYQFDY